MTVLESPSAIDDAELELLKFVVEQGQVTVRTVVEHFDSEAAWTRAAVSTLMDRLRDRGLVARRKASGVYRYSAQLSKAELFRTLVRDFVTHALDGSVSPFFAYLIEDATISDWQLAQLKRVVRVLESRREVAE